MELGSNPGTTLGVMVALFVFGGIYNVFVGWLEQRGYDEGYTAILVVIGVTITLISVAVVDIDAAVLSFLAFAASGFWMVAGSCWRYICARASGQQALIEKHKK